MDDVLVHDRLSASGRVLGFAAAEGPVFLLYLDEVDEDVFPPKPDSRVKAVRDSLMFEYEIAEAITLEEFLRVKNT